MFCCPFKRTTETPGRECALCAGLWWWLEGRAPLLAVSSGREIQRARYLTETKDVFHLNLVIEVCTNVLIYMYDIWGCITQVKTTTYDEWKNDLRTRPKGGGDYGHKVTAKRAAVYHCTPSFVDLALRVFAGGCKHKAKVVSFFLLAVYSLKCLRREVCSLELDNQKNGN